MENERDHLLSEIEQYQHENKELEAKLNRTRKDRTFWQNRNLELEKKVSSLAIEVDKQGHKAMEAETMLMLEKGLVKALLEKVKKAEAYILENTNHTNVKITSEGVFLWTELTLKDDN